MHRFETVGCTTFQHNGDFSGDITIEEIQGEELVGDPVTLPMADILDFVAEYIRAGRITELENQSTHTLLGLPPLRQD